MQAESQVLTKDQIHFVITNHKGITQFELFVDGLAGTPEYAAGAEMLFDALLDERVMPGEFVVDIFDGRERPAEARPLRELPGQLAN